MVVVNRPQPQFNIPAGSKLESSLRDLALGLIDEDDAVSASSGQTQWYERYHKDPVLFGEEVLGHTYPENVKEMMRSVESNVNTSAKSANAIGKTYSAADIILWFFLVFGDAQVYTFAAPPESNLRDLLWGEINRVVMQHPELFADFKVTALRIERHSKSFIKGVTIPQSADPKQIEARFSGKHAPHLMFVGDESDGVPDPVFKGIEGCTSGGHSRLLMLFNPRAEAGTPYQMEKKGEAHVVQLSAFDHPNVVLGPKLNADGELKDPYPGAVDRETTCRRINMWTRPLLPGERQNSECFEVPPYLVGYVAKAHSGRPYPPIPAGWRVIVNPQFSYMVLGQYPAMAENQLISRGWIDNARSRYDLYVAKFGDIPPAQTRCIMGLDVAELGQDLNSATFRYGGYVRMPIFWGGVDPIVTGDKAAGLYKRMFAWQCKVDGTGVGAGVAPYMRRNGCPNAQRIMFGSSPREDDIPQDYRELGTFRYMRDLAWWACREWLRNGDATGAMLPPCEELIEELITPTYQVKDRVAVMDTDTIREKIKRSPDRASSLILTFCPDPDEAAVPMGEEDYS